MEIEWIPHLMQTATVKMSTNTGGGKWDRYVC